MTIKNIHIYELPDEENEKAFQIFEVQGKKFKDQNYPHNTNRPHRHNYYEICVFITGAGNHEIDFISFPIASQSIHFLSPGQVHLISREENYHGFLLMFTREFYSSDFIKKDMLFDLPYFNNNTSKPILDLDNSEFLLHVPVELLQKNLSGTLKIDDEILTQWTGKTITSVLRIAFSLNKPPSIYKVIARVSSGKAMGCIATTELVILKYKSNEVKTDRLTGGLIVNRKQLFPFGFYCYSPVYPTLPEEEVVKGFNMMSPYQKIAPETLPERKAYMNRCAELGMKVNYNLLSVSGGGGVGSKIDGPNEAEKRARLIEAIKTFRDHPALLGWYIADEPSGNNITPDQLEEIYRIVKENDPCILSQSFLWPRFLLQ